MDTITFAERLLATRSNREKATATFTTPYDSKNHDVLFVAAPKLQHLYKLKHDLHQEGENLDLQASKTPPFTPEYDEVTALLNQSEEQFDYVADALDAQIQLAAVAQCVDPHDYKKIILVNAGRVVGVRKDPPRSDKYADVDGEVDTTSLAFDFSDS